MSKEATNPNKELQKKLTWKQEHIADLHPEHIAAAQDFCEGYKAFLNAGKTERECVRTAKAQLEAAGYKPFDPQNKYQPGDKVYEINRGKAIIACTFGTKPLTEGIRLNIAHIDSPRLDLKPYPLYEDQDIALFKTHYYGGIRKYQWVVTPLAIHGVFTKADGEAVDIIIGENPGDPVFCISDLLPHLAAEQNKRTLPNGIKGEELNVIVGSLPFADENLKDRVKLQVLNILYEQYGLTERDFICAELEIVPAQKAVDVGLDRSMIGAYGQDDRVCAYTALQAEIGVKNPPHTTVCILTDKEEIGSTGNTGLDSDYTLHFIEYLSENQGVNYKDVLKKSECLSADVNAAFDPTFPSVFDKRNSSELNRGVCLTKYTGSRGKSDTSDADAIFMRRIINIFDAAGVIWQSGELGAVDMGGGGTVAKYIASHNIDVIDVGVPLLSMHAPFELSSKLDVYNTYLAFKAFCEAE